MKYLRFFLIALYLFLATLPLVWMVTTSIKSRLDAISPVAKVIPWTNEPAGSRSPRFAPTLDAYQRLNGRGEGAEARINRRENFWLYLQNSAIIGLCSTIASVALGTSCAYGFSRFRIAGAKDWLFFILSTRFLPPLAVVVPIYLMWRQLNWTDTHAGQTLLYTAFNLSLATWLMKGFIDDIPRAFEEAALVDGYSRLRTFFQIVLPQARTGIAVTAVFCLISAWNEYGFAMILNGRSATTVPVYFAGMQGQGEGIPWPRVAAGALVFVTPVVLFTILVRNHLLRGVTFGTVKQ